MRRVHRKAPTTTTMMVKAPTEMMMTMTRMWFSLLPPTPDLPQEEKNWIKLHTFTHTSLKTLVSHCQGNKAKLQQKYGLKKSVQMADFKMHCQRKEKVQLSRHTDHNFSCYNVRLTAWYLNRTVKEGGMGGKSYQLQFQVPVDDGVLEVLASVGDLKLIQNGKITF